MHELIALRRGEVELVTYLQGDRVIVRDRDGTATIEHRDGSFRYTPINHDVLGYGDVIARLRQEGKVSADGFIADADWFTATIDHTFPDAPRRLWDAFHGEVINPPQLMLTVHDGYSAGDNGWRHFITMASTHGGLNQINSATFLLSMTDRVTKPVRSREIIPTVEPGYELPVRKRW